MKIVVLFLLLILNFIKLFAQQEKQVLLPDSFISQVKKYHPLIQKANLLSQQANYELNKTRGYFDPVLNADYDEKEYKGKNYFEKLEAGVAIQTTFGGLKLKSGYTSNTGDFLNPENNVPANGLFAAGAELPILQGLITDKYRTELRQAKLNQTGLEFERQLQVNNLLLQATENYWDWSLANWRYELLTASVNNTKVRFEGIKSSFLEGDKPEIDTIETYTQLLNLNQQALNASAELNTANNNLKTFVWDNNLRINNVQPQQWQNLQNNAPVDTSQWRSTNPELNLYTIKNQSLTLERRLKREYIKPELSLSYQFLTENTRAIESTFNGINTNDYKLGLKFAFPLFMRKSVNDLRLTKLKITDNQLALDFKEEYFRQLLNSLTVEFQQLQKQIEQFKQIRENYQRLLEAEKTKNDLGDSSVFLINNREIQLINAELKLLDLLAKLQIVNAKINFTKGNM